MLVIHLYGALIQFKYSTSKNFPNTKKMISLLSLKYQEFLGR